jgi:hypothetical protein
MPNDGYFVELTLGPATGQRASVSPCLLTPWNRVLLEKLTGSQLVNKFPAFMEPESSLLHSQVPATCPYPEPDQPRLCPSSHFLKIHLNIILPSTPGSTKWPLSWHLRGTEISLTFWYYNQMAGHSWSHDWTPNLVS